MKPTTLTFVLDDRFNKRVLEFKTTLGAESADIYYEAFDAFMLAAGFSPATVERRRVENIEQ